jgi:hypothetical protein
LNRPQFAKKPSDEKVRFNFRRLCSAIPGKCTAYFKSLFHIGPVTEMYMYKNTEELLDRIDEGPIL